MTLSRVKRRVVRLKEWGSQRVPGQTRAELLPKWLTVWNWWTLTPTTRTKPGQNLISIETSVLDKVIYLGILMKASIVKIYLLAWPSYLQIDWYSEQSPPERVRVKSIYQESGGREYRETWWGVVSVSQKTHFRYQVKKWVHISSLMAWIFQIVTVPWSIIEQTFPLTLVTERLNTETETLCCEVFKYKTSRFQSSSFRGSGVRVMFYSNPFNSILLSSTCKTRRRADI